MVNRRLAAPLTVAVALAVALAVVTLLSASGRAAGLEPGDAVLVGAGDIASSNNNDAETAKLLASIDGKVAALGDNAYENGSLSDYNTYYDPTWGLQLTRTMPSLGNHEYNTPGASGYFDYFSATTSPVPNTTENPGLKPGKGYYSYPLGSWHVVVLNSNCADVSGGCAAGSPQEQWLRKNLADHPNACTVAYFHHPRFSSSGVGSNTAVAPFWQALYDAGAEVVLNGHAHNYERFAPQTPGGQLDQAEGIREFIVGTGGRSLNKFGTTRANSQVRLNNAYGVIELTLHDGSYDWKFKTVPNGTVADSGSGSCHGGSGPPPPTDDTTPPTVKSTVPASGATGISTVAPLTATFSEAMDATTTDGDPSTINGTTFKLRVKGSTTNLPADISYDPATRTATLNPTDTLGSGITYKAIVTTGAEDLAGNRLDQKATTAGLQQKAWTFTTN
jgi:hypothetical protein